MYSLSLTYQVKVFVWNFFVQISFDFSIKSWTWANFEISNLENKHIRLGF